MQGTRSSQPVRGGNAAVYKLQTSKFGSWYLKVKENLKKNEKGSGSFGIFRSLYVYEGCSFLYNNAEQNESLKTQGGDRIWITL